jgi:ABC-type multidrug transport system ATPase subunit
MEQLGLQREKDSLIRKLSGGQKKRLSIATEFISDPSLFFLDEPDSGLDGVMARSLMENLRVIADDGKIVMVITHQPDRVADLFDKVIVLAKSAQTNSGRLAFYGSIREAMNFFDTESLEGIVRKINRPDEGGEGMSDYFIEKYKHYAEGQHI